MLINEGPALYLGRDGKATEAPGDGATVLVGQGGRIDEATARRHGIADRLKPATDAVFEARHTGDPYVIVDGRAVAKSLVEPANPPAEAPHAVEAKHIAGPQETKAIPANAPANPKPARPA